MLLYFETLLSYVQKLPNILRNAFDSQGSNNKNFLNLFFLPKSGSAVVIKKAMGAKFCLVLMLVILGTVTVQGAIPRNKMKNPLQVFARRPDSRECSLIIH